MHYYNDNNKKEDKQMPKKLNEQEKRHDGKGEKKSTVRQVDALIKRHGSVLVERWKRAD